MAGEKPLVFWDRLVKVPATMKRLLTLAALLGLGAGLLAGCDQTPKEPAPNETATNAAPANPATPPATHDNP